MKCPVEQGGCGAPLKAIVSPIYIKRITEPGVEGEFYERWYGCPSCRKRWIYNEFHKTIIEAPFMTEGGYTVVYPKPKKMYNTEKWDKMGRNTHLDK